jgi:uncharacterized repeat protein (TIGR03803 family)
MLLAILSLGLLAALNFLPTSRVMAQTFTTLHSFTALSGATNSDGVYPFAGLILSGDTLYGTARDGGSCSNGTVFKMNTDGTAFTILHSFTADSGAPSYINSDGWEPEAGLILSGNTLYGTARGGGSSGNGTVFAVNTDGTGFTTLYSFSADSGAPNYINSDGWEPEAGLILSGNTLYGTASGGGSAGNGTVFKLNTDGTGFMTLHSFTALSGLTNGDGVYPFSGLILSGNTLYGTAQDGGSYSNGTVFAVNTDGTGFTNLHSFPADSGAPSYTNSDGWEPDAGLILSGNTLYGTASGGGSAGNGTVFKLNTDGTGFTTLHSFTVDSGAPSYTNSDGWEPDAGLILSGNTLCGTASGGGSAGNGTLFSVNTNGTGFTTLYSFTADSGAPDYINSDGWEPEAGLILSGNTLFGTASGGGSAGNGTVFRFSLPSSLPAFGDANWTAVGSGMNDSVLALAVSGTNLYAGGQFTTVGGVAANYIAKWDGNRWLALGSGMISIVYALAVSGSNLYAGGLFQTAGGVSANYIAKWDGHSWSALGSGVAGGSSFVHALAVSGTNLYVGGDFTTAGGTPATNIAKWNGSSWSALGAGMNGRVYALAVLGNDLYAGGTFTTAGGNAANYIAKWDGTNWTALGSGMNGWVYPLAASGSDVYAGGFFTTAGGNQASYVAKWNGNSWSAVGSGVFDSVYVLAVSGSDLYAGGYFTTAGGAPANRIAKWDGSSWTALGSGMNDWVFALAVSGNDLYAGGKFTTAGGKPYGHIARAYLLPLPTLSVLRSGTDVTVSWPSVNTADFGLVQADTLSPTATWVTNAATITDDGATRSVTLPATNNSQFFRLRRP